MNFFSNNCRTYIEISESCIDECQKLIDVTSSKNEYEFAKQIEGFIQKFKIFLEQYKNNLNENKDLLFQVQDVEQKKIIETCIGEFNNVISACQKLTAELQYWQKNMHLPGVYGDTNYSIENQKLVKLVRDCIERCNSCAQSCEKCIEDTK